MSRFSTAAPVCTETPSVKRRPIPKECKRSHRLEEVTDGNAPPSLPMTNTGLTTPPPLPQHRRTQRNIFPTNLLYASRLRSLCTRKCPHFFERYTSSLSVYIRRMCELYFAGGAGSRTFLRKTKTKTKRKQKKNKTKKRDVRTVFVFLLLFTT